MVDNFGIASCLDVLAAVFGARAVGLKAARLWGAAEAMRETMDTTQPPDGRELLGPCVEEASSRLEETAWNEVWEEGRAMAPEQAIAYAMEEE